MRHGTDQSFEAIREAKVADTLSREWELSRFLKGFVVFGTSVDMKEIETSGSITD